MQKPKTSTAACEPPVPPVSVCWARASEKRRISRLHLQLRPSPRAARVRGGPIGAPNAAPTRSALALPKPLIPRRLDLWRESAKSTGAEKRESLRPVRAPGFAPRLNRQAGRTAGNPRIMAQPSSAEPVCGVWKWRPLGDSNPCYRRERALSRGMINALEHLDTRQAIDFTIYTSPIVPGRF